jgi:hypothetical protein
MGYNGNGAPGGNMPNQPSPKSKQKMSPRSAANGGVGRPPGPKAVAPMKMAPRMAAGSPSAGSPGSPQHMMPPGSPRPPGPAMLGGGGPPALAPMLGGGNPAVDATAGGVGVGQPQFVGTMSYMPAAANVATTMSAAMVLPTNHHFSAAPPPAGSPSQQLQQPPPLLDPPTLTKEINVPMPNLGQPHHNNSMINPPAGGGGMPPSSAMKPLTNATKPLNSFSSSEGEGAGAGQQAPSTTPKAVVKPQVLTHVIDGHIIKESSQPFPVSPVKGTVNVLCSLDLMGCT